MATINSLLLKLRNPALGAGFFCAALSLGGCQTGKSPETVTQEFWQTLAQGQVDSAGKQATRGSQQLINVQDIDRFSTVDVGEANVEDDVATVETTISRNHRPLNFVTVLQKEKDAWKVDYLQTQMNIAMLPLGEFMSTLKNLGGAFSKQLEQQLPQIQKQIESLGNGLKNQIEGLGRSLENRSQPNKSRPHPGTI